MRYTRRSRRRLGECVGMAALALATACGDPMGAADRSSFTADVTGAVNTRLTGTAAANNGSDWTRQSVVQVTFPNAGTFSGLVLTADDLKTTISLLRSGASLPAGTYAIAHIPVSPGTPTPIFTAGYVVRTADRLTLFRADSGSVTIAESGTRVTGTFTMYASAYDVIPMPTRDMVGQKITPIESGQSPMTITGEFDAARR